MPRRKNKEPRDLLIESAVTAMTNTKAENPVILDFTGMKGTVCDAFVICHGNSRTQTEAIAGHVIEAVKQQTGQNPWHQEGFENAEWILIDYSDVVIHIFQQERRRFYNLEQLWADAPITKADTQH